MLELDNIAAGYGKLQILHELSIHVRPGELVSVVGANGAGKTTTLRVISGLIGTMGGQVRYDGEVITGLRAHQLVKRGIVQVSEDRDLFGPMTVEENLVLGAWTRRKAAINEELERIFELFPILLERRRQAAQTMSGGQQQMLAIGRALMAKPKVLMLDEPSTGLSPKMTWDVLNAASAIRDSGVSVLLVEQNAAQALAISDRAYVLESGSVVLEGPGRELAGDERVKKAYLGL
ncbi:ABC transporter ATP-binding protein [Nocardioides sp. Iso805N]|uniref:ABC transporter ATP-binding protein n=1 Tax=Nocardioides sp. Iso805N TaxID=1283287 RepID=UPI00036E7EE0|nr:ABC transporter ATP-binding protein [Nocardioides sp. Iso805N]